MSLADDLAAFPRPAAPKPRKRATPEEYARRYTEAQVARAKAGFALGLPTDLVAKEAGIGLHSAELYRCGKVRARVQMDQTAYDAMFLAIRRALKGYAE